MVTQVKSFTSEKKYDLTINEKTGIATDCKCPDCQERHHQCKHMRTFNQEVQRAAAFLLLKRWVQDVEETARINRELTLSA